LGEPGPSYRCRSADRHCNMGTLGQKGKVRGLTNYSIRLGRTSQKKGGMSSGLNDVRNDLNNACHASCVSS